MKFNLIIADPAYDFSDKLTMSEVKRGAEAQYEAVMSHQDIIDIKVKDIADDNAIMALWVPSALIDVGLKALENYGFDYKQTFIWVKSKNEPLLKLKKQIKKILKHKHDFGTDDYEDKILKLIDDFNMNDTMKCYLGRVFRQTHEVALIGTRGKTGNDRANKSQISVFIGPNPKHSEKPFILHDRLEKMYPNYKNKLELFARKEYKDWIVLGNEISTVSDKVFNGDLRESIEILKNV
jgi:N6-adenosine-specific RNA methylase IME4